MSVDDVCLSSYFGLWPVCSFYKTDFMQWSEPASVCVCLLIYASRVKKSASLCYVFPYRSG